MNTYDLHKLLNNPELIENQIHNLKDKKLLFSQRIDEEDIQGRIVKAEHNLRFTAKIVKEGFEDWVYILLWSDQPYVFSIKNEAIARSFVAYFDALWTLAK